MLTQVKIKEIILDELRAKGYAPNNADVQLSSFKIMDEVNIHVAESIEAKTKADEQEKFLANLTVAKVAPSTV